MRTFKWLVMVAIAASLVTVAALNNQPVAVQLGVTMVEWPLSGILAAAGVAGLVLGRLSCWRPPRPEPRVFRT